MRRLVLMAYAFAILSIGLTAILTRLLDDRRGLIGGGNGHAPHERLCEV